MKRLLLIILVVVIFFPSCKLLIGLIGEELDDDAHTTKWYAKNTASAPIRITTLDITDSIVYPGDSLRIEYFWPLQSDGIPSFSLLYDCPGKMDEDQVRRIDILSVDGRLLRTWKYTERDSSGRQFFSEAYWRRYEEWDVRYTEVKLTWVFDILPEDIAPAKPEP